jgi:hypothetical protein
MLTRSMLRINQRRKALVGNPSVSIKWPVFATFTSGSFRAGCKADIVRVDTKWLQKADFSKKATENTPGGFLVCRFLPQILFCRVKVETDLRPSTARAASLGLTLCIGVFSLALGRLL